MIPTPKQFLEMTDGEQDAVLAGMDVENKVYLREALAAYDQLRVHRAANEAMRPWRDRLPEPKEMTRCRNRQGLK